MNNLHPIFAAAIRPFAPPADIEAIADALDARRISRPATMQERLDTLREEYDAGFDSIDDGEVDE